MEQPQMYRQGWEQAVLLPPALRSRNAYLLIPVAGQGRFDLPACGLCGAFAWPIPEACPVCLSPDMRLTPAPRGGKLISFTTVEAPVSDYFRARSPWRVGLAEMDCGPRALVHLHPGCKSGDRLMLSLMLDRAGQAVLHAGPEAAENMNDDPQWQEMTVDPAGRRVLMTNARHAAALPLAKALVAAGAAHVWLGLDETDWRLPEPEALAAMQNVEIVPLDLRSDRSVEDLARSIAGGVDILINTADLVPLAASRYPMDAANWRETMEVVAFGHMRLMRSFAPAIAAQGADGTGAWVNLMSVMARIAHPGFSGYCAAHAAALAQCPALRRELALGGVRLLSVFADPADSFWKKHFARSLLAGNEIACEIITALRAGLDEVVIGSAARDWLRRQKENPRSLEADLAYNQA